MLFQKLVIEDLFQTIKNIHNEEPWRAICHCIDHKYIKKSTMSEYEIYFNFVFSQNKSPKIRKLKWQEMEFNFENLDKLKADGYNYVSCHGWLKS